jgi:hypothetical protein
VQPNPAGWIPLEEPSMSERNHLAQAAPLLRIVAVVLVLVLLGCGDRVRIHALSSVGRAVPGSTQRGRDET